MRLMLQCVMDHACIHGSEQTFHVPALEFRGNHGNVKPDEPSRLSSLLGANAEIQYLNRQI